MIAPKLLLSLALLSRVDAAATIVIITPSFIVLGADSKAREEGAPERPPQCQIPKIGAAYYAIGGFSAGAGYDLHGIVSALTAKSLGGLADELKLTIDEPLKKALEASRRHDPAAFAKSFASRFAVNVLFFGFDKGEPAVADLEFNIADPAAETLKLEVIEHRCPGADCGGGYGFNGLPKRFQLPFAKANPRYWTGPATEVAAKAEAFLNLAIDGDPVSFGGPASILIAKGSKAEWHKPGLCQ